jgi:hypothetical protein
VTPTLIWGKVSAGCIRLRPKHIRELFRFARRHPRIRVQIIRGLDRVNGRPVELSEGGVKRLRRLRVGGAVVHDRVREGVDHWFALELRGGDAITVTLTHKGALRAELYGIRAISTVTNGKYGFSYLVPQVQKNRGNRYLRVVAPRRRTAVPYTLEVSGR